MTKTAARRGFFTVYCDPSGHDRFLPDAGVGTLVLLYFGKRPPWLGPLFRVAKR
jgi:hypothetical protein